MHEQQKERQQGRQSTAIHGLEINGVAATWQIGRMADALPDVASYDLRCAGGPDTWRFGSGNASSLPDGTREAAPAGFRAPAFRTTLRGHRVSPARDTRTAMPAAAAAERDHIARYVRMAPVRGGRVSAPARTHAVATSMLAHAAHVAAHACRRQRKPSARRCGPSRSSPPPRSRLRAPRRRCSAVVPRGPRRRRARARRLSVGSRSTTRPATRLHRAPAFCHASTVATIATSSLRNAACARPGA